MTPNALTPDAQAVLDFWLADGQTLGWPTQSLSDRWFGGGPDLDAQITRLFGSLVNDALAGSLTPWAGSPLGRLALVIVLDQFTRNVFRGQAQAFDGDVQTQQLVRTALDAGEDRQLPTVGRLFLYMPLMHAEDLAQQDLCVACFTQLLADAPAALKATLEDNLRYARLHRDIVAQFGRFPHRNAALGRPDTPEEATFLKDGPRFGQ